MTLETWLTYITTVLILMSTPGPSHLLMLSNSLGSGFRRALATAAGDLTANVVQMIIAAAGLAGLIFASRDVFVYIKWAGVSYLVFMGIRLFFRRLDPNLLSARRPRSGNSLYWQGFMTSAANPKAVIFFAALFPLFVDLSQPTTVQFVVLGVTYLIIDATFLATYGGAAAWIAGHFRERIGRQMNRISGSLLIVAAVLLGLKEIETG